MDDLGDMIDSFLQKEELYYRNGEWEKLLTPCLTAARIGCLKLLRWARKRKKPWNFGPKPDQYHYHEYTYSLQTRFTACAAANNNWHILKWAARHGCRKDDYPAEVACMTKNLKIIPFLFDLGYKIYANNVATIAAQQGDIEILEFLDKHKLLKRNISLLFATVGKSQIETFQWFVNTVNAPMTKQVLHLAAALGDIANFQFILKSRKITTDCVNIAAFKRHFDMVKWMYAMGTSLKARTFGAVASHCDFEMMQWMYEKKCPMNAQVFANVALSGRLDVMQWLLEKNCPWDSRVYHNAIKNNHLQAVLFAYENGCPFDESISEFAAERKCYDILKFLILKGFQCTARVCEGVARSGDLELFKFCVEKKKGVVFDVDAFASAALKGHINILQYMIDNGFDTLLERHSKLGHPHMKSMITHNIVKDGRLDVLVFLLQNGFEWTNEITATAAAYGRLDIIQYAHNNGLEIFECGCEDAARFGHLSILQFLHEKNYKFSKQMCDSAASAGRLDIVQFLVERNCPWDMQTVNDARMEVFKWLTYTFGPDYQ